MELSELTKKSILEMCDGAIAERCDYEVNRIIENIHDLSTNPTKKRTLVLTIDFIPNSERKNLVVQAVAKSKLEPTTAVMTALYIGNDENGEMCVAELLPQISGQQSIMGVEQRPPVMLKLVK